MVIYTTTQQERSVQCLSVSITRSLVVHVKIEVQSKYGKGGIVLIEI